MMVKERKFSKIIAACLAGTAATIGYAALVRPRILGWGATYEEINASIPGDEFVTLVLTQTTRAIDILAPRDKAWPWVVQIGQGRGGFYSYDWLENIFGMDIHNADHILPEHQNLGAGDLIPFWDEVGVTVRQVSPPELLVLAGSFDPKSDTVGGSWTFLLKEISPSRCRLIVRAKIAAFPPRWLSRFFSFKLLEPAHFVMERGMLLGIKQRAEMA
jgi:hypothetical protein